jgi:hypothetical protein
MDARAKFIVGQKVRPTGKARSHGLKWRAPTPIRGVVREIPDSYPWWTVRVQVVGQSRTSGYHMDFWEPVDMTRTIRFGWSCDKCRKRGSIALPADIDAWGGSEATIAAHRVKSPRCTGDAGTVRVTISTTEANKLRRADAAKRAKAKRAVTPSASAAP